MNKQDIVEAAQELINRFNSSTNNTADLLCILDDTICLLERIVDDNVTGE